jgi:opacity protein-like surface antigen
MKKNVLPLLMTALIFRAASAQECCEEESCCTGNFYAKVFGGANFLQNTTITGNNAHYHAGYLVSGSLGYSWCCGLSLEGEYAYRRNGIKKIDFVGEGSSKHGHLRTSSYMGNPLWDLSTCGCACWNLKPFIGAGVGYDSPKMHSSNSRVIFNQKWHHYSWQAIAGIACPIFCNTEVTVEYKFHQGGSQFYHHAVGVGLVYKFGPR